MSTVIENNESYVSTNNPEISANDISTDSFGVPNVRLYREVKWSLIRSKNMLIDQVMSEEHNLDDILENIAEIVDAYEKNRMLFKHYIFEGNVPEEFFANGEVEFEDEDDPDDEDINETDNMGNRL